VNRKNRAFTTVEVMAAIFIMLLCLSLVAPMVRTTGHIWSKTSTEGQAKEVLQQAALRLAPTLRNSLAVDIASSTNHKLVVILPAADPFSNGYIYPLVPGSSVSYYLSDTTGKASAKGSILWKATDGVPDAKWSLLSGRGRIDFGATNLTFNYDSLSDPGMVTLTAGSSQSIGSQSTAATATTSIQLRNHQLDKLY
jgi:hypothetical protein